VTDKRSFLKRNIETYWHCEGRDRDSGASLLRALRHPVHAISESEFSGMLASAILNKDISIQEYERLTGLDFESEDEVAQDLRVLWQLMYGDKQVTLI
jgi:hypothetical protein